jgi:hypothetical protein
MNGKAREAKIWFHLCQDLDHFVDGIADRDIRHHESPTVGITGSILHLAD